MNFNETVRILQQIREHRIEDHRFEVSNDTYNLLCMLRRYGVFLRQPSGIRQPSTILRSALPSEVRKVIFLYDISVRMSKHCDATYILRNLETIWKVSKL